MKKIATILMLVAALLVGGMTADAKTTKKSSNAKSSKVSGGSSFSADISTIKSNVKRFYEGAVLSGCTSGSKIALTKSSLSKYCTSSFLTKMKNENEFDDGGYAVWILRNPDMMDSDPNDRVISVEESSDNSVIVTYVDNGQTSKTRVYLKKEGGTWKINNCQFIS